MNDERDPLAALARHWLLALVLTVVAAVGGAAVGSQRAVVSTAEGRLVVGAQDLDAYRVAGYAEASAALVANYARYLADSPEVSVDLERALGARAQQIRSLTASPLPNSSVMRVEVTAESDQAAVDAVNAVLDFMVQYTKDDQSQSAEAVLADYKAAVASRDRAREKVRDAEGTKARDQATVDLAAEQLKVDTLYNEYQTRVTQPAKNGQLAVLFPAAVTGDTGSRNVQAFGLAGAGAGLFLALIVAVVLERRRGRRSR